MLHLAQEIIALTNSNSKIVHLPLPQDDPKRRCPDISRAKSKLQWEPEIPLREGLSATIKYFEMLTSAPPFRAAKILSHSN